MLRTLRLGYLYLLFAALGMYWIPAPLVEDTRLFQLLFLILIGFTALSARALLEVGRIIENNIVIFMLFAAWALTGFLGAATAATNWDRIVVIRFTFYFASALCIVGNLNATMQSGRAPSFSMFGWSALGGFLFGIFVLSGLSPLTVSGIVTAAIQTGNPDLIIFNLFGNRGVLYAEGVEFAAVLRHTISMVFVVCALLAIFDIKLHGISMARIVLVVGLIFIVFLMQSRSSWLCLATGVTLVGIQTLRIPRFSILKFTIFFVILVISAAAFIKLLPLTIARLSEERSFESRSDYLGDSILLFLSHFFEPVPRAMIDGSPHNFIFDTALTSGVYGFLIATAIILWIVYTALKTWKFERSGVFVALLLIFVIRSFTVGSGIPGPGTLIGLMMFFWYQKEHVLPQRTRRQSGPAGADAGPEAGAEGHPDGAPRRTAWADPNP